MYDNIVFNFKAKEVTTWQESLFTPLPLEILGVLWD